MLEGVKCLVTGASSGIGLETAKILTSYGAEVVGSGRNVEALEKLRSDGHLKDFVAADLTKEGACQRVVENAASLLGDELNAIVNAAGVLQGGAMGSVGLDNYTFNMTCNTQVPFEIMEHAIPHLKRATKSSIVNISSVNGKQSFAGCATYCMSKAALDQLTRCASVDLAPYGIRVNSINPGVVATNLQKSGGMTEEQYQAFLERSVETTHPIASHLGRVGEPREVGELVAFLLSDKALFLTGECIALDGARQNLGAR